MKFFGNFKDNINRLFHQKEGGSGASDKGATDTRGTSGSQDRDPQKQERGRASKDLTAAVTEPRLFLRIVQSDQDRLDFSCLFNSYRFFRLKTQITGESANFFGEEDKNGIIPSIIEIPVQGNSVIRVEMRQKTASAPGAEHVIHSALCRKEKDSSVLEFSFTRGNDEISHQFIIPGGIEITDFAEVKAIQKVFDRIPPVSQMGMLLKTFLLSERSGGQPPEIYPLLLSLLTAVPNDRAQAFFSGCSGLEGSLLHMNLDNLEPVQRFLQSLGIATEPVLLAALGLFIEAEVSNMKALPDEKLTISPYSIMAIAESQGCRIRAFAAEGGNSSELASVLTSLNRLSPSGILLERSAGEPARHVKSPEEISDYCASLDDFHVLALASVAVIDHLSVHDLETLLKREQEILASFQSDFDKCIVWKKLRIEESEADRDVDESARAQEEKSLNQFYMHYRSFQFMKTIMGTFSTEAEQKGKEGEILIYRDSRGSRQYKWHTGGQESEDAIPADWTKTDERIEFSGTEGLPPLLFEASINRLLDRRESKTKEEQTLAALYPPLRSLLTKGTVYGSSDENRNVLTRIYRYLKTQEIQDKLSRYISARTIEAMLKYINPESTGMNIQVLVQKSLIDACSCPAVIPIASYITISSLCLSEHTEVKGYFKSFDDKNFRFILRNSISELIESGEPALRGLAVELLSSRNVIANRNDLLMADYDIERCREDSDATVREKALHSKLTLILRKNVPLLKPVDCIPSGDIPGPVVQAPRKSAAWESKLSKDIDQVIIKINEYIENAPKTGARGSITSMETTSADLDVSFIPFLDNIENKKYIARTIVGINEALKADEKPDKSRFLFVIPEVTLEELLESVLATWNALAEAQGRPFQSLFVVKQPEELIEDFMALGKERSAGNPGESSYVGGNYPLMIHRIEPQKLIKAVKTIENKKVSIRRKKILHKLLVDLVIMGSRFGLKNLRICRAAKAGGLIMEEVENTLTAFTTDREVQAHDLEVFNFQFARFVPFFNLLNIRSLHLTQDEETMDMTEQVLDFYKSLSKPLSSPAEDTAAPQKPGVQEDDSMQVGGASTDIIELSRQIARAFNLPDSFSRQILNIIFEAAPQCLYDIWS